MSDNKNLHKAKSAKEDEFYTLLGDIEKEMSNYRKHFKGKTVLCNCDDPYESNFVKYFAMNFNSLGLKKLIATCYVDSKIMWSFLTYEQIRDGEKPRFPPDSKKKPYYIEINYVDDYDKDGKVDLLDIEYLLKNDVNTLKLLKGNGDFRSKECLEMLDEADIVVTNPPFSLFREYIAKLIEHKKKFIVLGNINAITYKEIFPLIKENKLWTGYKFGGMEFKHPDGSTQKLGNITWYTNLETKKRHEPLILFKKYDPGEYPKYDNYDAINISKVSEIPEDYDGMMGVPITFIDKYCPEQFEIIGMAKRGAGDPKLRSKVYTIHDAKNYSDLNAGPVLNTNGILKNTYPRLLIRRKDL